jgi:hypothetical protein
VNRPRLTDQELRDLYWWIPWDEPWKATLMDERGNPTNLRTKLYVCRYCVAHDGLRAWELRRRQDTYDAIKQHIAEAHH